MSSWVTLRVLTTKNTKNTKKICDEIELRKQKILVQMNAKQAEWFDEEIDKLNNWAEDKRKGLKADLKNYDDEITELKKAARLALNLPEKLASQKKIRDIDAKRNTAWKEYDEAAKTIELQKDSLLDSVEAKLRQNVTEKNIFTVEWKVV